MKKVLGVLISLFLVCFSATAAELSGSVEMHSRLISTFSGTNYSENPAMVAQFTVTKGLSFTGFFSADLKDTQSFANIQDFIVHGTKTIGQTAITGMLETVRYGGVKGAYLYPSVNVAQPLGKGFGVNFLYCYGIEGLNDYEDMGNYTMTHIGLTKKFDNWSVVARGHRNANKSNFSSAVTREINKNVSLTGFFHLNDVRGTLTHFGGVTVGYSF